MAAVCVNTENMLVYQNITTFLERNIETIADGVAATCEGRRFKEIKDDLGRVWVKGAGYYYIEMYTRMPPNATMEFDIPRIRHLMNEYLIKASSDAECICTAYHPSTQTLVVSATVGCCEG